MSIRLRLTLYWAAVLGGILLVSSFIAFTLHERQQIGALDAALLEEADTSAEEIARGDLSRARAIISELSRERDLGARRRVQLTTSQGVIADFGDPRALGPKVNVRSRYRGMLDGENHAFRFAVVPVTVSGQPGLLLDGADTGPIREDVARLRTALLLSIPLILVLCVAGGYWLAGRALAPIESVTSALAAIDPGHLQSRLPAPPVADEVGRLTSVINALLDRLERASATERRFASDAAHELRTPLAVLRTGLEVTLARDRTGQEARAALESAHREVVELCKIAEELLMLARLNGEVAIDREPVDLGAIAAEVAATVEPLAAAKEISLSTNGASGVVVRGNEGHLRRLVINLLDNALKFTPPRGKIGVEVAREGSRAILRVADTGPGIDSAEMPLIFQRFFRGNRFAGEGAGLGLSLCHEIVRLHGGEITAANRAAGGSEFVVRLPLGSTGAIPAARS